MKSRLLHWGVAQWWMLSGRVARNARTLNHGSAGLRILTFHETGPELMEQFKRTVNWCRARFPMASPRDADALFEGSYRCGSADQVLITFDDGFDSNYEAAKWLAEVGVQAVFFVVPSFIDRSWAECAEFHSRNGVVSRVGRPGTRGLRSSQVSEMISMGHRIAAHNYAHRDLGGLSKDADLEYEITRALDGVAELTGRKCEDFAIAYGQPENLSAEAESYLVARCPRVFACHRGLNIPGRSPGFLLRHDCRPDHPDAFTRICILGAGDHRLADRADELASRVGRLPFSRAG